MGSALLELTRALRAFDAMVFVTKHGGRKESTNVNSHEYLLTCPLCQGSNLRWNPMRAEALGGWVCWGCGVSGNTLYLVQLFERCDGEDAINFVMDGYHGGDANLELSAIATMPTVVKRTPKMERLPRIHPPPHTIDAREHPKVRAYLWNRGIDDTLIARWAIRAGTRGIQTDFCIFPVNMDGALVYWQCRASWDPPAHLNDDQRRAWVKATHYRKTLNPPNAVAGIAQATAGDVLFNYDRARNCGHVVVVEGPVDAIKVGPHSVALLGKGTPAKIERLRRMGARRYTIYLDRGEQERAKAMAIAGELQGWAEVHIATPPVGHDPGSLTPEWNTHIVDQAEPVGKVGLEAALKAP